MTNEFSYKESLMDFAKAGGHLAERIAQKYYDHNQAMVFLRRKQQENIMKSFHQRSQEQCIPPLFLFQQQQQQQPHQMNYRRILPMHQKWNPNLGSSYISNFKFSPLHQILRFRIFNYVLIFQSYRQPEPSSFFILHQWWYVWRCPTIWLWQSLSPKHGFFAPAWCDHNICRYSKIGQFYQSSFNK